VKPLYYYYDGRLLLFGSELKALIAHPRFSKELNPDAVSLYLYLGFVPAPLSIFKNTRKVRPGCYVEFSAGGEPEERSYWSIADYHTTDDDHRTERQGVEAITALRRGGCADPKTAPMRGGALATGRSG